MTDNKDDRDLDQYLAGKDGLTRQYRSAAQELPPSNIDETILAASRKAVGERPNRFMPPYFGRLDAPLAIAAVVVLSVLVVFNLPDQSLEMVVPSEADLDMDSMTTSAGAARLEAVTMELAEDRMAEKEVSSNATRADESATAQALSASPARITVPAIEPALAPEPVTPEDMSANVAEDNAQTIVEMQKAMRMQTEEQFANSESARMVQPSFAITMDEPAQMEPNADSVTGGAGQSQFTACATPRPEVCTMEYLPVCATRDTGIRCVTTPCDSTEQVEFSNACHACGDADVIGYVEGSCPAP